MKPRTQEATFLLVDDDEVSIISMKRVLRKLKIVNNTIVARDGHEALEILRSATNKCDCVVPPFIVILDLNMPRMNGLEFLEAIRSEPALRRLVVLVFAPSDMAHDIDAAYSQNVAGYLTKENPGEAFSHALEMLGSYARIVELPV